MNNFRALPLAAASLAEVVGAAITRTFEIDVAEIPLLL
jgi:hypothetical protein